MEVEVNGLAWLPKEDLSYAQLRNLKHLLTVIPRQVGDYAKEDPQPIYLFEETDTHIGIARGFFQARKRAMHNVTWDLTDGLKDLWAGPLEFEGTLRSEQKQALDEVVLRLRAGQLGGIIRAVPGWGKCLGLGTPVLKYDGTIVPVEDVREGDSLMGPDSTPRRVTSTTRGWGKLYKVVPTIGDAWVCNDAHILTLVNSVTNEVEDIAIEDWLRLIGRRKHHLKQFSPVAGVEYAPQAELPLDPYFMGVWFGDGSKTKYKEGLRRVAVSKPDPEILVLCKDVAAEWGLRVRTDESSSCPTHHIVGGGAVNSLLDALRAQVGSDISVPPAYLTASREDRRAFLAGWLDSDGYHNNGCYQIVQKRRDYAEAVAHLARGLGIRATIRPKVVKGETYHRVQLAGDFHHLPLRIARKLPRVRKQKKTATRTGFVVEDAGEGQYAGFTLDGDGRFLLGDHTVTHNTVAACALVAELNVPTLVVVHKEFLMDQWEKRIAEFLPGAKVGIVQQNSCDYKNKNIAIGMVHSLGSKEYPDEFYEWPGLVVIDEVHRIGAYTWSPVPQKFKARWRIGFSATPKRKDGADNVLAYHIGPVLFSAKEKRMSPKVKRVWTDFKLVKTNSFNPNLAKKGLVLRFLTASTVRNRLIVEQIIRAVNSGRKLLVLSERVKHLQVMDAMFHDMWPRQYGGVPTTDYYVGGRKKDELKIAAEARVIFATSQYAQEGLDIPALDTLFLTTPLSDVEQAVGRILRPFDGKKEPIVVDIRDDNVAVCERGGKSRDRYYSRVT